MSSKEPPTIPTASSDPNAPTKTYTASCHCGKIKFSAKVSPPLEGGAHEVASCNCSICTNKGYLLIYLANDAITFESGQEEIKGYSFNKKQVEHCFCPNCGSALFISSIKPGFFEGMKAVNVRNFKDIEIDDLKLKKADGRSY
ncbi:putative glutathione-dependent formaldehyde-activating protein [Lasiodiplodia theobromae]|uniref:Centromere protein V n=1 Tax=Lasiodiplodia hormozganensis TaxID=869390 RepID=A0AA39YD11_9PEZI|nr:Aldehyde-activating protein [Lasiodiplodia theobromae]KAF4534566.1 Aldehyde-activating protein [Lasiodiplodia theobromae]KAF9636929.1 putative glutathione-dependent formaldehyde-activating protein [Lasiodiplodia theobromae]KAK0650387.1 Centromere protein V [Lasiodiplodia hormozganensis]